MSFSSADSCSDDERERWNRKYSEASCARTAPDAFLPLAFSRYIRPLFPGGGKALDLAGGAGRHAIWLAKRGWDVTLIDLSETGVEVARQQAGPLASHIHFVVDDLTRFTASQTLLESGFNLVTAFFYLERAIFGEIVNSMRPGGLLVYKTFTSARAKGARGPSNPAHLLAAGELLRLAAGLRVLHYREEAGARATAELVAKREG
ncbi:MAG: class I SAM-dependent methyltransferase [Terriglobales bacterium]|jgi:SAM-dependent methyltransferase